MKLDLFDYDLPPELIAQSPLVKRDSSRLLVFDRENNEYKDTVFSRIIDYLTPNDILIRNNTKVIPARLFGVKEKTNGRVELLLLKDLKNDTYECLVGNARIVQVGTKIILSKNMFCQCLEVRLEGIRIMKFFFEGIFLERLEEIGEMPLPPYIRERDQDKDRYQTVYADIPGSSAAPTAGFHFTEELLKQITNKGIKIIDITLEVGLGTFRPVKVLDSDDHIMHQERYYISEETADILNQAKYEHKRFVAIGTTTVRTLEANFSDYHKFKAGSFETNIFITPGYKFKAVDAMITNFHLPKSTLLMLVSAFSSRGMILKLYQYAVNEHYRFFSFGDAMFIY